ncbi:MAG: hypothetical protein H7245_12580, partial [Candidatus Saccharibacteria bacterium]|nr:hypothetical protein [Pseudorhodobacter sp.]
TGMGGLANRQTKAFGPDAAFEVVKPKANCAGVIAVAAPQTVVAGTAGSKEQPVVAAAVIEPLALRAVDRTQDRRGGDAVIAGRAQNAAEQACIDIALGIACRAVSGGIGLQKDARGLTGTGAGQGRGLENCGNPVTSITSAPLPLSIRQLAL